MISERTRGVFIISVTPFTDQCEIDFRSFDSLIEFYLEKRVHGLTILGMMGEANKMTFEESVQIVRHVLKRVAGRAPVVVGASNAALINIRNLARTSMDAGASGVMIAPITGLATDDRLYGYYAAVLETLGPDIPVVYQDYPQSTGSWLSVSTLNRLVRSFPQLVMIKHEDCPGLEKLTLVREEARRAGLRRLSILVGNGGLYFPQELRRGADGAMTGFGFPEMLVQVYERFASGDPEGGEDLFDRYLPLVRYEQQPGFGLAVRKEILRRRGAISFAKTRKPGPNLTSEDQAELDILLTRLEQKLER